MKKIPVGSNWTWLNDYLTTCLDDGTVTLNTKIIAIVDSSSISKGNKALIAAAPEMLEALESVRLYAEVHGDMGDLMRRCGIRKIIAKATGGA